MAANLVPEARTRAWWSVAAAAILVAVLALGSVRDALPLAAVTLAFVLVRGWRRDRAAGFYG
jgi:hypothetical protein